MPSENLKSINRSAPKCFEEVSLIPPDVALACMDNAGFHGGILGIYCLPDGSVIVGERAALGVPHINLQISTISELVRIAIRRWYSGLPEFQLMQAFAFPERYGYLAYCETLNDPICLTNAQREDLIESTVSALTNQWPPNPEHAPKPMKVPEGKARESINVENAIEISDEFIGHCRSFLRNGAAMDLENLLAAATAYCRGK